MFHEVKVEIATTDSESTCLYHMLHGQVSDNLPCQYILCHALLINLPEQPYGINIPPIPPPSSTPPLNTPIHTPS